MLKSVVKLVYTYIQSVYGLMSAFFKILTFLFMQSDLIEDEGGHCAFSSTLFLFGH